MPETPDNVTDKFFLHYNGLSGAHVMQFRRGLTGTVPEFIADVRGLIMLMRSFTGPSTSWHSMTRRGVGETASFGVPWGAPIVGTSAPAPIESGSAFISFVGRDIQGKRCRISLMGWSGGLGSNFRVDPSEMSTLQAVLTYLGDASRLFRSVSNLPVLWNQYANVGYNAYFQRRARRVS